MDIANDVNVIKIVCLTSNHKCLIFFQLNPEDENVVANIKTESRMDVEIEGLKKEISDIIDEQCVVCI